MDKLIKVVEWARPYISNLFVFVDSVIGSSLEPALTNANLILGTILGPPFTWEWNRNYVDFPCTPGITDYIINLCDFGFIESSVIGVPSGADKDANDIYRLQPRRQLEISYSQSRPGYISVFKDDLNCNITFRVGETSPDIAYNVRVTYQKSPVFLSSSNTNIPIPGKMMHIFRWGFLAMAFLYDQDSRFAAMNQKFISTLLASQSGLDEGQKNIFLSNWYNQIADQISIAPEINQGKQSRNI